jgi:hypothetical protein
MIGQKCENNITGKTVQGDYLRMNGNFSQRLGGMFRVWMWRMGTGRSFIGKKRMMDTSMGTNEEEVIASMP